MKNKKAFCLLLITTLLIFLIFDSGYAQERSSDFILEQSLKFHDPDSKWNQTILSIHIQEPRILNPGRFSKLSLHPGSGKFSLSRDYEIGEVSRIISDEGEAIVLVNGSSNYSQDIKEEYRLDGSRNMSYRNFYQILYGFPMSLKEDIVEQASKPGYDVVFDTEYIMIEYVLKESIISDRWKVYFSKDNYSVQALRFVHTGSEEQDEVILFDREYTWDGITIPRFRHWYLLESKEYQGSDIIVKGID